MSTDDELRAAKAGLRALARRDRDALAAGIGAAAATAVIARFIATPQLAGALRPGRVAAGYAPIGSELDCTGLLRHFAAAGLVCALPVTVGRDAPLEFRRWAPGDPLVPGAYAISVPPADAEAVVPELVLVPLLAFDRAGNRLGYGGGYYDRTLRALRADGAVLACGMAFAGQLRDDVPAGPDDARLDWIVTEAGAWPVGGSSGKVA